MRDQQRAPPGAVDVAHLVADAGGDLAVRLVDEEVARVGGIDVDPGLDAHHVGGGDAVELVVQREVVAAAATDESASAPARRLSSHRGSDAW